MVKPAIEGECTKDKINSPCVRWKTHEVCKRGKVLLANICEEELIKNNWTKARDQKSCLVSKCKPKNIYTHHAYPNPQEGEQDEKWGTTEIFDVANCEPRSYFPNGDSQKICGKPDYEYYWETSPWTPCCTPHAFQTRKIACVRVDKNLNIKTEIDGNDRDNACGGNSKDAPLLRKSCQCSRWRAKAICDGQNTAVETECQTSTGNLPWIAQNRVSVTNWLTIMLISLACKVIKVFKSQDNIFQRNFR